MRKLVQVGLILTAMTVLLTGCNPYKKMQKNVNTIDVKANPEVLSLVGNSVSTDVTVNFPAKYFQKGMILKFTPVLEFEGGEIAGTPKYFQAEDVKENYTTVSKSDGGTFPYKVSLPYDSRAKVSTLVMRIEGRYAENKKAELVEFAPFGNITIAQGISTVQNLAYPHAVIIPDNFKRITTITEEAEIRYQINSANVRNNQLSQEQIKLFKEFVKENQNKENVTLGNVYSKGYASPDGPEKFNDKLSSDRSQTGEKAIKNTLKGTGVSYDAAAYGEDWDGFRKLVEASNIQDKDLILQVLAMYDNSARRDQEIKNLSKVYEELKKSVLPQLRRTQFVVSADIVGKSDQELIAAVRNNDRTLTLDEMLYAATLVEETKKADVYRMAAAVYDDMRAHNNLAVVLLENGDIDGAQVSIEAAARKGSHPTVTNNMAAIAIARGDVGAAKQYLAALNNEDARQNKGIIAMHEGDYAAAERDLKGYSKAVAQVLNGDYAKAKATIGNADYADAEYLRAVIAVKEGDSKGAIALLKSAIAKKPILRAQAKQDIEFAKLFNDPEFKAL